MAEQEFESLTLHWEGLSGTAIAAGEGPVVLCLHGFPDHARSFRYQLPALAAGGLRAIAPMLRGYEPSSQPGPGVRHYHPMRVAGDVIAWAEQLGTEPIHLVGHDWGAVVTYLACALAPQRFRSATTIAVPSFQAVEDGVWKHPGQLRNSWYMFFFQLRGLADAAVRARDFAFIERLWHDWSPGWAPDAKEMVLLKDTFRQPGVARSALAYYRATFNPFLADSRRLRSLTRKPVQVPMLAISGAADGCLDTRIFDCMDRRLFPAGLRVEHVDDAGHFVHQERPDAVNSLILDWIGEYTKI